MNSVRTSYWILSWALLLTAMAAGSLAPLKKAEPVVIEGYRVLAADFHTHTFPGDWGLVAPWDAVLQARRDGLDVISLAAHNRTWNGQVGKWFAKHIEGPIVFVGEEIVSPHYHLLAVGIQETISWRQSARSAIDEIHRQGGIAIAAHPVEQYWPAYDASAMQVLDAAEILHPISRSRAGFREQLKEFALRGHPAAIGNSDWRFGPMGWCRTFVFTQDVSEQGVLDAIRKRQTVVYDRGQWFGDARLIELAASDGRLAYDVNVSSDWLSLFSRTAGTAALFALILFGRRKKAPRQAS